MRDRVQVVTYIKGNNSFTKQLEKSFKLLLLLLFLIIIINLSFTVYQYLYIYICKRTQWLHTVHTYKQWGRSRGVGIGWLATPSIPGHLKDIKCIFQTFNKLIAIALLHLFIHVNLPDLSGIPDFLFARYFFLLDMVTVTLVVPQIL